MDRSLLCTICARGGSKGVAGKNTRLLNGKPLIAYTIEAAKLCGLFEHVVLSTDSDSIAEISVRYGAEVFFRRPAELATDSAPKIQAIRHALVESERHFGMRFEVLVDLDATSPLRSTEDILGAYRLLLEKGYANVVTGTPSRRSPYFNLVEKREDGTVFVAKALERPVSRRQDSPLCFDMNASVYVWRRSALLEKDSVITPHTGLYVMPEERSIDIDSELDFQIVEFLMERGTVR